MTAFTIEREKIQGRTFYKSLEKGLLGASIRRKNEAPAKNKTQPSNIHFPSFFFLLPPCAVCVYVCVYGSVRLILSNEAGKKMVHVFPVMAGMNITSRDTPRE